ncbi:MAG: ABC transporter substrate-binding protein [Oscillospiraceae bacterium]
MNRIKKLAAFLMVVSLLAFTACGSAATSSASSASPSASQPAVQTPTTVKIALGSEPDNLDPMLSAATDTSSVMMNVFEGLLAFNQKGEFIPAIAEAYTISEDELTYTFTIKQGILFHNGKECTAQDVKYTYEKLAGLNGEDPLNSALNAELEKVETPDDYTVVLTLKNKDAGFLSKATISISQKDYADNSTLPIGTGPYKFVEYVSGQKLVLEKNENYSTIEGRTPTVDRAEFIIMTDENAKLMALKSGSLDIGGISASNAAALGTDFQIVQGPQNMVQVFALNNSVKPLNDVKVRQAISYAIDKDEIITTVMEGSATRVESFLSPSMAAYYNSNIQGYQTNVEKAKELLKEAGYENGFTLTIKVPSNYQTHVDTAQVIKDQLSKIGVNVEIQLIEWAQWLEGVYTNRDYEATIIGHSGKLDPQDFLNRFSTTYARNYFNFSNAEYDALIAQGASTADEAVRAQIYKECQQMLVDQAASVFIADPHVIFAVANNVKGLQIYPVTFFNLCDLTVEA